MDTQIVKWGKTLLPVVLYLALHQLLRAFGIGASWRVWLILPVVAVCYRREESHVAGGLRLSSARGMGLAALTAGAVALLNAWCFPGGAQEMTAGMLAATVIAGPIGEELLYRGIVFDQSCRFFGRRQAVILSALLFGLAHGGAAQMVAAAIFGGALCLLRMRYRSIAAPILVHGCVNFLSVCGIFGRIPRMVLAFAALAISSLTIWLLCCEDFTGKSQAQN